MKKCFALLMALIITFMVLPATASAATSISGPSSAAHGATVKVTCRYSGAEVYGIQFTVSGNGVSISGTKVAYIDLTLSNPTTSGSAVFEGTMGNGTGGSATVSVTCLVTDRNGSTSSSSSSTTITINHSYTQTTSTPATCQNDGQTNYACACGATKSEPITKLNHNFPGTWTKYDAITHRKTCTLCNTEYQTANHSWNAGVVTTPAACNVAGVKTFTCSACGATKTESIDALTHVYSNWTKVDDNNCRRYCTRCQVTLDGPSAHSFGTGSITKHPACGVAGVRTYTCSKCGTTKTESINALSHSYTGAWVNDSATQHKKTCDNGCGTTLKEAHTWNSGTVTVPATCKVEGTRVYTCSGCQATKSEKINKLDHTFTGVWQKNNTTTHKQVCSACGDMITEAHKWNAGVITTTATCIATGETTYTCTVCGETKAEPIAKLQHSYTVFERYSATQHKKKCSTPGCNAALTESHTWNKGSVTTDPGCTTEGVRTYTCTGCAETKTESISATGHTYGAYEYVNDISHKRTCTVCSNEETTNHNFPTKWTNATATQHSRVCSDCKHAAYADHVWDTGKITTPAACTTDGVKTFTCTTSGCGATKTEPITKTGHTPAATEEIITPVTCLADGLKGILCTVCKEVLSSTPIPHIGHVPSAHHVIRDAVCGVEGVEGIDCTVCGEVLQGTPIPALVHVPSNWVTRRKATCEEEGLRIIYCTLCNRTLDREKTRAKGHKPGEPVIVEPATYTKGGRAAIYCTVCEGLIEEITTDMLLVKNTQTIENGFDVLVTDPTVGAIEKLLRVNNDADTGRKSLVIIVTDEKALGNMQDTLDANVHLTPDVFTRLDQQNVDSITLYAGNLSATLPLENILRTASGEAMPVFTVLCGQECDEYRALIGSVFTDIAIASDVCRVDGLTEGALANVMMPTGLAAGEAGQEKFVFYLIYTEEGYMLPVETTYVEQEGMIYACAKVPAYTTFTLMQEK